MGPPGIYARSSFISDIHKWYCKCLDIYNANVFFADDSKLFQNEKQNLEDIEMNVNSELEEIE